MLQVSEMMFREYLKTLPEHEQRQIARGSRLLDYIIKKRCKHPEMLANPELLKKANPKVRGVAGK